MTHQAELDQLKEAAFRALNQNQVGLAASTIQKVLVQTPDDSQSLVLAGIIEIRRSCFPEAEIFLQKALEKDPENIEGLIVLSKLFVSRKRLLEAIPLAEAAVLVQPQDPELWCHLGTLLNFAKRSDDAIIVFSKAVAADPTHAKSRGLLATALRDAGNEHAAIDAYGELVKVDSRNSSGWMNLARLYLAHGRFAESIAASDKVLKYDKNNPTAHLMKALGLSESQRGSEAEPHLRLAIKLNPEDGLAKAALGYWFQEEGKFDESLEMIDDALRLLPNHGFAYYNLFRARKATKVEPAFIEDLRTRALAPDLHIRDKTYMNYALGKAYEDLKEFEASIHHYSEGNKYAYEIWLGNRPWERNDYRDRFSRTMETFTQPKLEELAAEGLDTELPLMIVGMMRSGTSLLEQILSSHPDVIGAGELPFWHDFEEEAYGDNHVPTAPRIRKLGERYLADLKKLGPKAKRITDKLPHNYAMLGLIHTAFPKAKIIHVKRSPADNCLSIFTTAYQRPPVFAHDRDNIVFAYKQYQRIIAHWREVLPPENFMEIQYEDLIADRDNLTRKLIEFSGLPWNDACLHHEKNERAVRTPSLWQVRQPIYTTSIARWKRFEPWIPEFTALLEESERK
jgi:tetratricopeptide (TPR) repeat protein